MSKFKKMTLIREEIIKRIPKEISVFMNLGINTIKSNEGELYCYYRFLLTEEGTKRTELLPKKDFKTTRDLFKQVLKDFFTNKQLVSSKDEIRRVSYSADAYLGICLQNEDNEKLNIYYSKEVLFAYDEMKRFIQHKKETDYYENAKQYIVEQEIERFVFYPSVNDRSEVLYIRDNEEYNMLRIQKQLGYYYRKSKKEIDASDLYIVLKLIRLFINSNLEFNPKYSYQTNYSKLSKEEMALSKLKFRTINLKIECDTKTFIEITDEDLMTEIEHARILDDLWLVMNGVIEQMPLQEDSLKEKEFLLERKRKFLQSNPNIVKGIT